MSNTVFVDEKAPRIRKRSSRITFQNLLSLVAVSLSAGVGAPAGAEHASRIVSSLEDLVTLKKWQSTASETSNGKALMEILDSTTKQLSHNSTDSNALFKRGYLLGVIGCTNSAIVDLSKAINIDPSKARFYAERAQCFMDMKLYSRALQDLNESLRIDPRSGDALLTRGRLQLLLRRPEFALMDLLHASSGSTRFQPILPGELSANYFSAPEYYLGECYEQIGREDEASFHYREYAKARKAKGEGFYHRSADCPRDVGNRLKMLGYRI